MTNLPIHSWRQIFKRAIINSGLEVSALLNAAGLFGSARGQAAIFTLHHIRPHRLRQASPNGHLEITPEFLDVALAQLRADGYRFVRLEDLPHLLASGDSKQRYAAFTCDDGYRNNVTYALPVFEKYQAPVTIFISSGFAGRTAPIWWEVLDEIVNSTQDAEFDFGQGPEKLALRNTAEKLAVFDRIAAYVWSAPESLAVSAIQELAARHGIDALAMTDELTMPTSELRKLASHPLVSLGAHTIDHPALARLKTEDMQRQMKVSADFLEEHTGKRPVSIAYPYGSGAACGEREFAMARSLGFQVGVTTCPGTLTPASITATTALPRISLNGFYQKQRFVRALASGIPFALSQK